MKKQIKTPGLIDVDFSTDEKETIENLKLQNLIQEILVFYGYPPNSQSCISKEERIMWIYGAFAAKYALSVSKNFWEPFYQKDSAEDLAPKVCRSFFEEFGHHIIPTETDLKSKDVLDALKAGSLVRSIGKEDDETKNPDRLELSGSRENT